MHFEHVEGDPCAMLLARSCNVTIQDGFAKQTNLASDVKESRMYLWPTFYFDDEIIRLRSKEWVFLACL